MKSKVEEIFLNRSKQQLIYTPHEKLGIVVVNNFPELGKLAALRFIEWVQQNPEGVVSLPTGKTPEYFIKELCRFLDNWDNSEIKDELSANGIDPSVKAKMNRLRFVQIDEFYPINPEHHNSFYHYVNTFYLDRLGIDREKALLINCNEIALPDNVGHEDVWGGDGVDLSLRNRAPVDEREDLQKEALHQVDQWCVQYEDTIRSWGGIGFFLGGIGPDGHIGFNVRGSDMYSTTRLTDINYETQAAAAADLGGIEVARRSLVITIGLSTITFNRDCAAIIIAAGEAKAGIVARAVTSKRDVNQPATSLLDLENSRFYLTEGAARGLAVRQADLLKKKDDIRESEIEDIAVTVSLLTGKRIEDLTREDYLTYPSGSVLMEKTHEDIRKINIRVRDVLISRINAGRETTGNARYLHTEPHDDDIMLGYLPFVVRHIRDHSTTHFFATFTSGFTAVTNTYMLDLAYRLKDILAADPYRFSELEKKDYFLQHKKFSDRDVWVYLDGVASLSKEKKEEGRMRRFVRDLMDVFKEKKLESIPSRVKDVISYFETRYPGQKDEALYQKLKGLCREWESACLWGYFGWPGDAIEHLRLGFYQGDIFTEQPTLERDVAPVVDLLNRTRPDTVTVALDPEASGPDTHYKVLQAVTEALKIYNKKDINIIGYRNVWYRFMPHEANVFVPVSLNMMTLQYEAFMNTYISQSSASFPSHELDGPFPLLAQKIQVQQYEMLKTCLGKEYFYNHDSALIRATRGFVFLKKMTMDEFITHSRELKRKTENR
jgi:glucosamine-6-phosphate deaminase